MKSGAQPAQPNPGTQRLVPSDADLALVKEHFDFGYYAREMARAGIQPPSDPGALALHYVEVGWRQGLSPSPSFDVEYYLSDNPDVREAAVEPFLHYLRRGIAEGRLPRAPTADELALIDTRYYKYRYPDLGSAIDAQWHFPRYGWRELRDPNPFTHLQFIYNIRGKWFESFFELAAYLRQGAFLNALLARPCTLLEIRAALAADDNRLDELFSFDATRYSSKQYDVLARSPLHPVEHLFYDGLSQNRLRRDGVIHECLLPVSDHKNDYEALVSQTSAPATLSFDKLSLAQPSDPTAPSPPDTLLAIGTVLFENSHAQIRRLLGSVAANVASARTPAWTLILDNSPTPLDLGWVAPAFPHLMVEIETRSDNPGFAKGHNILMERAFANKATHYLALNPDGFLLQDVLDELLSFAVSKGSPTLVELNCEPLEHPKWYHPVTCETDWVSGAAFTIDREAYLRTGGFDPAFPMYCEDVDLSWRARQAGVALYVAPRRLFYHDITGRFNSSEPARDLLMLKGLWYLCRKWGSDARAQDIEEEIIRRGNSRACLPPRPSMVRDIPPFIQHLMKKERFSYSRFWAA